MAEAVESGPTRPLVLNRSSAGGWTASLWMSAALTALGAMSFGLDRVLARQGDGRAGEADDQGADRDQHRRRGQPPVYSCGPPVECSGLPPPEQTRRTARKFRGDEDLGRLHRRGPPARAAADDRARCASAATRSRSPPASTARPIGILDRLGLAHEVVGRHGGASTPARALRARLAQPRARPLGAAAALRPRARPRLGRHRGGRHRCCGSRPAQMQDYEYAGPAAQARLACGEAGDRPRRDPASSGSSRAGRPSTRSSSATRA